MMNGWTNSQMVEADLIIAILSTRLLVPLHNRALTRVHHTVDIHIYMSTVRVPVLVTTVCLKMSFRA